MTSPTKNLSPELLEVLRVEYDLIQGKIDLIGGFKFRIRGWALTLLTGLILAFVSSKVQVGLGSNITICVPFAAIGLVLMFHLMEQNQTNLSRALGRRAAVVERIIDLAVGGRPMDNSRREKLLASELQRFGGAPRISYIMGVSARKPLGSTIKGLLSVKTSAFYLFQYFMIEILGIYIFWQMGYYG